MSKNLRSLLLRDGVHAVGTFVVAFLAALALTPVNLTWDAVTSAIVSAAVVGLRKLEPELKSDVQGIVTANTTVANSLPPVIVSPPTPPATSS